MLWLPRFILLLLPRGVPSSPVDHPRDNPKGRLQVTPLYPNSHTPCQAQTVVALWGQSGAPPRWDRNLAVLDPSSVAASPWEGLGIPLVGQRCHEPAATPPGSDGHALMAAEKVTTTNPQWGGRADLRIGGRSSDLLIGNQIPTAQSRKIKAFHDPATTLLPA